MKTTELQTVTNGIDMESLGQTVKTIQADPERVNAFFVPATGGFPADTIRRISPVSNVWVVSNRTGSRLICTPMSRRPWAVRTRAPIPLNICSTPWRLA